MRNSLLPKRLPQEIIFALVLAGLALGLAGCATNEDDSTLPWAQPAGWEHGSMPGGAMMPNYGNRTY